MPELFTIGLISEELSRRTFKQFKFMGLIDNDEVFNKVSFHDLAIQAGRQFLLTLEEQKFLLIKEVLTLCVDPDWLPFEAIRDGNHVGIAADIFDYIKTLIPIPIEVLLTKNWAESVEAAKARECDLYSLASSTPERLTYMDFTDSYIDLPIVMATKNDTFFVDSIESVKHEPIGIVKGYAIAELLRERYPDINIVDVETISEGLAMLEQGKLYGYVDNLMTIADLIQKRFTGELKISARLDEKVQLAIGTRNDEPILKTIFQSIIQHVNIDETQKQQIYNNWVSVKYDRGMGSKNIFAYSFWWRYYCCFFSIDNSYSKNTIID
jgi:polar amino acid transport system substrate-binding protein